MNAPFQPDPQALVRLDPHLIDASAHEDRLEHFGPEEEALRRSIARHGQQVPILVRPHPQRPGRYQIVYGRRRTLALRDLGLPALAFVLDLDDRELVIAQGTENTARRGLSFLEKAVFARKLLGAGHDRETIRAALHVDKTQLSRMLAVAERIPPEVAAWVGAAPGIGRDRWTNLSEQIAEWGLDGDLLLALAPMEVRGGGPDACFHALQAAVRGAIRRRTPQPRALDPTAPRQIRVLRGEDGDALGTFRETPQGVFLRFRRAASPGFPEWLRSRMGELHRQWRSQDKG